MVFSAPVPAAVDPELVATFSEHWLLLKVTAVPAVAGALQEIPSLLIKRKEFVAGEYSTRQPPVPFTIVFIKKYTRSIGAPPGFAVA